MEWPLIVKQRVHEEMQQGQSGNGGTCQPEGI